MTDKERIEKLELRIEKLEEQILQMQKAAIDAANSMHARLAAQTNTQSSFLDGFF